MILVVTQIMVLTCLATGGKTIQESDKSIQDVKSAVYAFFGAIDQQDWEYVWDNSTEAFRSYNNYSLLLSNGLLADQPLEKMVDKYFDSIEWEKIDDAEFGNLDLNNQIAMVNRFINNKKGFFVEGWGTIPARKVDLSLRVPSKTENIEIDGTTATVHCKYKHSSYKKTNNGEEQENIHHQSRKIYLKMVDSKWRVESPLVVNGKKKH